MKRDYPEEMSEEEKDYLESKTYDELEERGK